jgi:RNA polymerase sigma-70 factor (ECF subfamily)
MPTAPNEFATLMQQAVAGCPDAFARLVRDYSNAIRRVVRRRLNPRLRSIFDSVDFMQEVWASFFKNLGQANEFADAEGLIAYLVGVARNKVEKAHRAFLETNKRDLSRRSLFGDGAAHADAVADRAPTPLQAVQKNDDWEHYLNGLTPAQRCVLRLLRDGLSQQEIAARLGVNERTVRRLLHQLPCLPAAG